MLNKVKTCLERIRQIFTTQKRTKPYNKLSKKYSALEHSMSEFNSPADRSEVIPNKFMEESGKKVFIKPDID